MLNLALVHLLHCLIQYITLLAGNKAGCYATKVVLLYALFSSFRDFLKVYFSFLFSSSFFVTLFSFSFGQLSQDSYAKVWNVLDCFAAAFVSLGGIGVCFTGNYEITTGSVMWLSCRWFAWVACFNCMKCPCGLGCDSEEYMHYQSHENKIMFYFSLTLILTSHKFCCTVQLLLQVREGSRTSGMQ